MEKGAEGEPNRVVVQRSVLRPEFWEGARRAEPEEMKGREGGKEEEMTEASQRYNVGGNRSNPLEGSETDSTTSVSYLPTPIKTEEKTKFEKKEEKSPKKEEQTQPDTSSKGGEIASQGESSLLNLFSSISTPQSGSSTSSLVTRRCTPSPKQLSEEEVEEEEGTSRRARELLARHHEVERIEMEKVLMERRNKKSEHVVATPTITLTIPEVVTKSSFTEQVVLEEKKDEVPTAEIRSSRSDVVGLCRVETQKKNLEVEEGVESKSPCNQSDKEEEKDQISVDLSSHRGSPSERSSEEVKATEETNEYTVRTSHDRREEDAKRSATRSEVSSSNPSPQQDVEPRGRSREVKELNKSKETEYRAPEKKREPTPLHKVVERHRADQKTEKFAIPEPAIEEKAKEGRREATEKDQVREKRVEVEGEPKEVGGSRTKGVKGKGKGKKGKSNRWKEWLQTQSQPPARSRSPKWKGKPSRLEREGKTGKGGSEGERASGETEGVSGRFPPGLEREKAEEHAKKEIPFLPKASSKASGIRAPPLPAGIQRNLESVTGRRWSEPSRRRIREVGPTPNRLIFSTRETNTSSKRKEAEKPRNTAEERASASSAKEVASNKRAEEKKVGETENLTTANTKSGERSTSRKIPWGLPTGKSREDRADRALSSCDDPNSREQTVEPPIRCLGRMVSSVKERARAALALWAELGDRGGNEVPRILTRYPVDVIKVAQRGVRFAQQVLETGSYNKAKSSIRSYERMHGAQGSGIGADERQRFTDAVKNYENRAMMR